MTSYLPNPFSPIGEFDPAGVFGHTMLLHRVLETVTASKPQILNLVGPRWIGKSTLLQFLAHPDGCLARPIFQPAIGRHFAENQIIVLYWDTLDVELEDDHPWLFLADQLVDHLSRWPKIDLQAVAAEIKLDQPAGTLSAADVTKQLKTLAKVARDNQLRVILCLDHLDRSDVLQRRNLVRQIEILAEFASFVLASRSVLATQYPQLVGSPLIHKSRTLPVGLLEPDAAIELLQAPLQGSGQQFPDTFCRQLIRDVGRHPFFLTTAAAQAFDHLVAYGSAMLTQTFILTEIDAALRGYHERFWQDFEEPLQSFHACFVENSCKLESHEQVLRKLQEQSLIQPNPDGGYQYFSTLFQRFVAGKVSSAPPGTTPGEINVDEMLAQLKVDKQTKEGQLLQLLIAHRDEVVTDEEVLPRLWPDQEDSKHALQTTIARLQSKIRDFEQTTDAELPGQIIRLRGRGYMFQGHE